MSTSHPTLRTGLVTGGIAMLGTLAVLRLLNALTGSRPLAESLADGILLLLPVNIFAWFKSTLGDQSKTWLLIGIVIGFVAVGCGLGAWITNAGHAWRNRVFQAAAGIFVLAIGLIYLIDRAQLRDDFIATTVTLAAAAGAFGFIIHGILKLGGETAEFSESRRLAIGTIIAGIGAIVIGRDVHKVWQHQADTVTFASERESTPAITPNNEFYRISKNFVDPTNDRDPIWTIDIDGEVDQPSSWNYEQFAAMGVANSISTMLCISNEVGGDLIGTAEWMGVPLATVLDNVGANGDYVYFTGADDYETSVPMDRCRHPQAWLVWGMNGEPLPEKNGAPVRAMISGLYGMKSVKWLTKMTISNDDRLGYWEKRSWTNEAVVKPMSRIDFPKRTSNLKTGTIPVRGVAFGGDGGLKTVEISTDDGKTWSDARITEQPNPGGVAWSLWQYDWAAEGGQHTLVARMIATDGSVQTDGQASPLPDGSSGWHTVPVMVNRQS